MIIIVLTVMFENLHILDHRFSINSTTLSFGILHRFPILNPSICLVCRRFSMVFFPTFKSAQHSRNVITSGIFLYIVKISFTKIQFIIVFIVPFRSSSVYASASITFIYHSSGYKPKYFSHQEEYHHDRTLRMPFLRSCTQ